MPTTLELIVKIVIRIKFKGRSNRYQVVSLAALWTIDRPVALVSLVSMAKLRINSPTLTSMSLLFNLHQPSF